jgi:transposase
VTGSSILSRSNDSVPVETRLQLVLAVLAHEMTVAEAARRHGVSAGSINRWRNRFVDVGKAALEDGILGQAGSRGSQVERRQRAEIHELKLALAEATVRLRIWQKGSEYVPRHVTQRPTEGPVTATRHRAGLTRHPVIELAGDGAQRRSCAGGGSQVRQLGRRPSAPLDMVDCLAATRSW